MAFLMMRVPFVRILFSCIEVFATPDDAPDLRFDIFHPCVFALLGGGPRIEILVSIGFCAGPVDLLLRSSLWKVSCGIFCPLGLA